MLPPEGCRSYSKQLTFCRLRKQYFSHIYYDFASVCVCSCEITYNSYRVQTVFCHYVFSQLTQPKVQPLVCEICEILLNMKGSSHSKRLETTVLENFFWKSVWVNPTSRWWYETTYYKKCNSNTHILLKTNLNHLLCDNLTKSIFTNKVWPHINDYFSTGIYTCTSNMSFFNWFMFMAN